MPLLLILILIASFTAMGYILIGMPKDNSFTTAIYICLYFVLFFFVLVTYWIITEIRKKLITVSIQSSTMLVGAFYGIGSKKIYDYTEFDGFITTQVPVLYAATYEYLYLIKGDKKIVILSDFYHRNYAALKLVLGDKLVFLGDQPFNMSSEIKELL